MANLAGLDQLSHRADSFFDRYCAVDTMQVKNVDHLNPETLQRFIASLMYRSRTCVSSGCPAAVVEDHAEFSRNHPVAPAAFHRVANERFAGPIHRGGIEQRHAQTPGVIDQAPRVARADGARGSVVVGKAEAAEPQRGDLQTALA